MIKSITKKELQSFCKLKQKKERYFNKRYIISGFNSVKSALEAPAIEVEYLLMRDTDIQYFKTIISQIKSSVKIMSLTETQFQRMSEEKKAQGIALIVKIPEQNFKLESVTPNPILYLEAVNDPGNLGTIIRSALWFGFRTLLLGVDSVDPYNPKCVRASTGYVSHIDCFTGIKAEDIVDVALKYHIPLRAATAKGGKYLEDYSNTFYKQPAIYIFGSEAHGISKFIKDNANDLLTIQGSGNVESLNLSISVTLLLNKIFQSQK
jgi:TrmH family RNA methyltransferase